MGGILENVKVDLPAKEFYENAAQPFVKSTGEIVGLVPRTIHASLAKLETWVLKREYAVKQIEKELKAKLEKYPPEEICEPDMAVAGPAIEAASWRSNSETIGEMYVNLLTKSMLVHEKENAHPAFVEIIKQLSPDEAKMIKQMFKNDAPVLAMRAQCTLFTKDTSEKSSKEPPIPLDPKSDESIAYQFNYFMNYKSDFPYVVTLNECGRMIMRKKEKLKVLATKNEQVNEMFSLLPNIACCEYPDNFNTYFENLVRLNVIKCKPSSSSLREEAYMDIFYDSPLRQTLIYAFQYECHLEKPMGYQLLPYEILFTNFGKEFAKICVGE